MPLMDIGEARLWPLFANAPGFMALLSGPEHVFKKANLAYQDLVGPRDLLGRPVSEALPELFDQGFLALLDEAYRSGEPHIARSVAIHLNTGPGGDRALRHIDFIYQPIRDDDGAVSGILVQGHDVSEHKQTAKDLLQSQEELRSALETNRNMVEHSLDVICNMDATGAFKSVNPRAFDMWGYTPQELLGIRHIDLVHPDDVEKTRRVAEQIMGGVPTSAFENRFIRKDGSVIPLLWSAVWSEEHGTMFAIARDLTERLEVEGRLRQAQKMEALGQLTGGIAHDFNNLLTVVLGNAEVLMDGSSDPAVVRSLAEEIIGAAERGANLTQHLLAFGRRQSLKLASLSLQSVVEGILPLVRRSLGEQIELRTDDQYTPLAALADRTLLESAILNLALNARDAMPNGGTLTITTRQRAAREGEGPLAVGQDVVSLTVSDTGIGMTDEVLRRAFEPFFTTKDVGSGSGLGLSMILGFAEQSGGEVAIQSAVGRGTSVSIVLPAVIGALAPEAAEPQPPNPAGVGRVLLVEDEPRVLQFVSAQLLSLGYAVTAVANAPDAVSVLNRGEDFDLLLTDIVLPKGMSGLDLAKTARRLRPSLKVLLTSGYSDELSGGDGAVGAEFRLLRKPYRRQVLAEAVRAALHDPAVPAPRLETQET